MDDRLTVSVAHGREKSTMDTETPAPPTDNRIVTATEVVVIHAPSVLAKARRIQRELPRLDWHWCLRLAQLGVEIASAPADPLASEVAAHYAERQYAHGAFDGWREAMS